MKHVKIGKFQILDESRVNSTAGTGPEYLCLRQLSPSRFELSVRGYQILGETRDYYDKETESFVIPDEIDGSSVAAYEADYVVGGQLVNQSDDILPIEFSDVDQPVVTEWLERAGRHDHALVMRIRAIMQIR